METLRNSFFQGDFFSFKKRKKDKMSRKSFKNEDKQHQNMSNVQLKYKPHVNKNNFPLDEYNYRNVYNTAKSKQMETINSPQGNETLKSWIKKSSQSQSNIPISTLSAAMNVAVEMRKWKRSAYDNSLFRSGSHSSACRSESFGREKQSISVSSSTSSENINLSENLPLSEWNALFISSDESDDDASLIHLNLSNESLNSLLSETSSRGTESNLGHEQPSPPLPIVLSATIKETEKRHSLQNHYFPKTIHHIIDNRSPLKHKTCQIKAKGDFRKAKNILSTFTKFKLSPGKKIRNKSTEIASSHEAAFDVYGSNSLKNVNKIPMFIKDNVSPLLEQKNQLHSFVGSHNRNASQFKENRNEKSSQSSNTEPSNIQRCTVWEFFNQTPNQMSQQNSNQSNKIDKICQCSENIKQKSSFNREINRSGLPESSSQKFKSAARVVLGFDGNVIFSTNSLDCKHYNKDYLTIPYLNYQLYTLQKTFCGNLNAPRFCESTHILKTHTHSNAFKGNNKHINMFTRTNQKNLTHSSQSSMFDENINRNVSSTMTRTLDTHLSETPDPNVSGLPTVTRLHSKPMEKSKEILPNQNSIEENVYDSKSQQSRISTEHLFAIIHDSKKRLNIKTTPDVSISPSRSTTPTNNKDSRGTLAETGFLSPRNQQGVLDKGQERRSWADFRSFQNVPNEKKSLASDRLGPAKPTSMHDFKMLLLRARTNSSIPGPRKSAVEMLKLQRNQENKISTRLHFSPRIHEESYLYNGHSTVPLKRGNKVRTSLQLKYARYPPIFEDCSEDSENNFELVCSNRQIAADASNVV